MPIKSLIFSIPLQGLRPVIWFGTPVYQRATQLQNILRERLGDAHGHLLAEPYVSERSQLASPDGKWFSEYITNGTPLPERSPQDQTLLLAQLSQKINDVKRLSSDLQKSADNSEKQLGEFLLKAIEVPDLKYVLTEGDKIVLVLWGFDSDEARRSQFQLSRIVDEKTTTTDASTPSVSTPKNAETPPIVPNNPPPQPPQLPPPPPTDNSRFKVKWWWIVLLLLILALAYYFWSRPQGGTSIHLPTQPGVLPPVDTSQFYRDPNDSLRHTLLGNRFNILLKKGQDINKFADKFKAKYPDPSVKFVFYDTLYNMLQLEFPIAQRDVWRKNLQELPEIATIVDEQIFQNKRQPSETDFSDVEKKWYFDAIGAFSAWDITQGNPSLKVAIIDDGFDPNHVEYKDKIEAAARNITANNTQLTPIFEAQLNGFSPHGTHVAATAVGKADNGNGVSGIAPNCRLLPLQIGLPNGSMSTLGIVMGIQYAILQGAAVINMSLGSSIDPMIEEKIAALPLSQQQILLQQIAQTARYKEEQLIFNQIFSEANRQNIVIVKAAGNSNMLMEFDAMATTPYTLNVAAIGPDRKRASFSSFSANTVCAPGVHIYNAAPGNTFTFLDGTSMASPIVTGAVALIRSQNPQLTPAEIKNLLIRTGDPVVNPDKPVGPIIRLDRALGSVSSTPKDPCQDKIDSLQREIDRLKGISGPTPPPMVIPCNPKDIQFAVGKWLADNSLLNNQREKVQLTFDIQSSGDGEMILNEPSGAVCKARIKVSLKNDKLVINQLTTAPCTAGKGAYNIYEFDFISNCGEEARCNARNKTDKQNVLTFKLFKE